MPRRSRKTSIRNPLGVFRFQRAWLMSRTWPWLLQGLPAAAAIVGFVAFVLVGSAQSDTALMAKYISAADAALADEDYHRADLFYQQVLVFDKQSPHGRFGRAVVAEKRGDLDAAVRLMSGLAAGRSTDYTPAHIWTAEKLMASPGAWSVEKRRATLYHLEQAVRWQPENYRVQYLLGHLYSQAKQWDNAVKHFEIAAKASPEIRLQLARVHVANGNDKAAEIAANAAAETYRGRLKRSAIDVDARVNLASALLIVKEFENAAQVLIEGLEVAGDARLKRELATVYVLWADQDVAELGSANPKQLELLQKAITVDPQSPIALVRLAALTSETGGERAARAREMLETALAEGVAPALVHAVLGSADAAAGRLEDAQAHLRAAYKQNPRVVIVLNNLAWVLMRADDGDLQEALEIANQAVELNPNDLQSRDTRGQILARLERWDEALTDLELALPAHRNYVDTHMALQAVYTGLGNESMAQRHRQLAEKLVEAKNGN